MRLFADGAARHVWARQYRLTGRAGTRGRCCPSTRSLLSGSLQQCLAPQRSLRGHRRTPTARGWQDVFTGRWLLADFPVCVLIGEPCDTNGRAGLPIAVSRRANGILRYTDTSTSLGMSCGIPGYPCGLPGGSAGEAGPVPPRPLRFAGPYMPGSKATPGPAGARNDEPDTNGRAGLPIAVSRRANGILRYTDTSTSLGMSCGIPGYPCGLPRGSAGEAGPVPPRPLRFAGPYMPGSKATPGPAGARNDEPASFAFRGVNNVGTRVSNAFAAQWLAYTGWERIAGWGLHPLESAALSRRTPIPARSQYPS